MKTAILKTNLWDDDTFYELNIDTKLLYLLLMSAPERGVSDVYMVSDRILSVRSGLNENQLRICKTQLMEKDLADFSGKFVLLKGSAYVFPKKGRFTDDAMLREYSELPQEIKEKFNSSLIVEHYNNTIYNDNDNNKDVDNDKDNGYTKYKYTRTKIFGK